MIKIEKCDRPKELTDEKVKELTGEYQKEGSPVWKKPYIEQTLLASSFRKCAFCETMLGEEGKYMQVEHFLPKSRYPESVVDWENLLPSCGRCNTHKSDHDTAAEPIINPSQDIPSEHIKMRSYRLYSKTELGRKTIDRLDLNDKDGLQVPRLRLAIALHEQIEGVLDIARPYDKGDAQCTRRCNQIVKKSKEIMRHAERAAEYSATMATAICENDTFAELKAILERCDLWDDELEELHQVVLTHSLL